MFNLFNIGLLIALGAFACKQRDSNLSEDTTSVVNSAISQKIIYMNDDKQMRQFIVDQGKVGRTVIVIAYASDFEDCIHCNNQKQFIGELLKETPVERLQSVVFVAFDVVYATKAEHLYVGLNALPQNYIYVDGKPADRNGQPVTIKGYNVDLAGFARDAAGNAVKINEKEYLRANLAFSNPSSKEALKAAFFDKFAVIKVADSSKK